MNYNPLRLRKHKALWISVHLSSNGNLLVLCSTQDFHMPPRKCMCVTRHCNEKVHHLESIVFYFIKQIISVLDTDWSIWHSSHAKTHNIIAVTKLNGELMYASLHSTHRSTQTADLRLMTISSRMPLNTFA